MPARNLYTRTGYMKGGVIQFRPVKKAEWFGILRSKNFPCISFSGDTVKEGVMIAAGDMASWNRLPAVLLYSTSETCYSTVEFVYQFGKELKKGEKHSVSAFIMPINADAAAADMQENFLKLKDRIK